MQIIELPLFELEEPAAALPAAAHVANFPSYLGQVYPTAHTELVFLMSMGD